MILIDILPDDVLLAIFDFCVAWRSLVHVCGRWRSVVFGSPRHLKLQLVCTAKTRARDRLDVWPALPLIVRCNSSNPKAKVHNIVAALERRDRMRRINLLSLWRSHWEPILAAMQELFPELTHLNLSAAEEGPMSVLPDSFLGGFSPRLRNLKLSFTPFPGLPKLLLSATHLVTLQVRAIPYSGYFSPDAMATALSLSPSLKSLLLHFLPRRSHPDRDSQRPPLLVRARTILPAFTSLEFRGVSGYLDDLVACIDAPLLNCLQITFYNQIVFGASQIIQFISRTPKLKTLEKASITFFGCAANVDLSLRYKAPNIRFSLEWHGELDRQVSSLAHMFNSSPPFSTLKDLYIDYWQVLGLQENAVIENAQWLELLHPFTAANNLYLSEGIAIRIIPALKELVGGRTTEVLPTLQNIFVEGLQPSGPVQEGIGQFVAARQIIGHPIAVTCWVRYGGEEGDGDGDNNGEEDDEEDDDHDFHDYGDGSNYHDGGGRDGDDENDGDER